jgi:prepilin-type N-terminal cleavage/methylation domain-containing protein
MSATSHDRRAGMTLIELLVVISILGLLAVTVLPNLSNTRDRRKVREAARAVSGFIAGGQSRALGSRSGGGVWIDPLPNQISSDSLSMVAAIDLAEADVPQPYSGNATNSTITALNPAGGFQTVATFSEACGPLVSGTNLIRLGVSKTAFLLTTAAGTTFTTGTITMSGTGTGLLNQTIYNSAWPKVPPSGIPYTIIGPPTRSPTSTLTLGDGVAIDVTHSTFGVNSLGSAAFQLLFDSTGRPHSIAFNGSRAVFNDPLYLLVASIESMQTTGTSVNRAPEGSYWVAIDPMGGIPRVAEVYTSGTSLVDQQRYIRQGAVQQGR